MLFELEKPITKEKEQKKAIDNFLSSKRQAEFFTFLKSIENDHLYWDKIKYKQPFPDWISREDAWQVIKLYRKFNCKKTFIKSKDEKPFTWIKLNYFEEFFHEIDMNTGGELFVANNEIIKANKQKLLLRGVMEEAIASSQLEGAATSRQVAKKLLREGRKPINRSEQMILNNYLSMKSIEEKYKNCEMSLDLILELHSLITKDTLDSQNEKPRIRKDGEGVSVQNDVNNIVYHEAPPIKFVKKELDAFISFANNSSKDDSFTHPIIKAIMLHFWMAYLHPFTDGNGRLARLIFYWYLIKNGYWAFAYLPISKAIKKSPKKYIMAYVYSEQDDNDLTYFLNFNISRIKIALKEFKEYINNQALENIKMNKECRLKYNLNLRQIQLLQFLYGNKDEETTLKTHMNVNMISKMTAFNDLKDLEKKGLLSAEKRGRSLFYFANEKIHELF